MKKLVELKQKKVLLAELEQEIEILEKSSEIQQELAFKNELEALLQKHGKTINDIAHEPGSKAGRERAQRKLKIFLNPHTREKVETRGSNHRILKAWKFEYGAEVVEGWLQN